MSGWANSDATKVFTAIDYETYQTMIASQYGFYLEPYGTELIDNPVVYINQFGYILPSEGNLQTIYPAESIRDNSYYENINDAAISVNALISNRMGGAGPLNLDGTHYLKVTTYVNSSSVSYDEDGDIVLTPNSVVYTQDSNFTFETGKMYVIEYFNANSLLSVSAYSGDGETGIKITVKPLDTDSSNAIINDLTFIARGTYRPISDPEPTSINLGTITFKNSRIEFSALNDVFESIVNYPAADSSSNDVEIIILNGDNGILTNEVEFKHVWAE